MAWLLKMFDMLTSVSGLNRGSSSAGVHRWQSSYGVVIWFYTALTTNRRNHINFREQILLIWRPPNEKFDERSTNLNQKSSNRNTTQSWSLGCWPRRMKQYYSVSAVIENGYPHTDYGGLVRNAHVPFTQNSVAIRFHQTGYRLPYW